MYLQRVIVQNFRNFENLDLFLNQGFVVLTGPNGAGKTNFLEGLYFGSCLKKFPDSEFGQLFQDGTTHFRIGLTQGGGEPQQLEVFSEIREGHYHHQFRHNHQKLSRPKYAGHLPAISFLPQDLHLLAGSPAGRRRFLNEALTSVSLEYRHHLTQYEKTLHQRGELLQNIKRGQAKETELEVWDESLAGFGSVLIFHRQKLFDFFNEHGAEVLNSLSPNLIPLQFQYLASGSSKLPEFLAQIKEKRNHDLEYGTTSVGPHRDDFAVLFSGKGVVGYLSRGQLRVVTLALKILEKQYLEAYLTTPPIILLDDVFSEFDSEHQEKLVHFLQGLEQVFLTTAHLAEVEKFLPAKKSIYFLEQGQITPQTNV